MLEQERLVAQLNFHAHADRMELREMVRQQSCKWELKQLRDEFKRREQIGRDVTARFVLLKERWTPEKKEVEARWEASDLMNDYLSAKGEK